MPPIIAASDDARLTYVVDVNAAAAQALAKKHGAAGRRHRRRALADPDVDAVIIASSTDTHADLAIAAARAGKAIFCEKPIDLSLKRVDACLAAVAKARRADAGRLQPPLRSKLRRAARAASRAGEIGAVEQVIITSRDPGLPPIEYLKVSGGQFRDMTIHDFDMARWLLGEEPVEVFAYGSCLVDPAVGEDRRHRFRDGRDADGVGPLCHINNSRRATYGYDQRIEVHGVERPAVGRQPHRRPRSSWPMRSRSAATSRSISSSSAMPTPTGRARGLHRGGARTRSRCRSAPRMAARRWCSPRRR